MKNKIPDFSNNKIIFFHYCNECVAHAKILCNILYKINIVQVLYTEQLLDELQKNDLLPIAIVVHCNNINAENIHVLKKIKQTHTHIHMLLHNDSVHAIDKHLQFDVFDHTYSLFTKDVIMKCIE